MAQKMGMVRLPSRIDWGNLLYWLQIVVLIHLGIFVGIVSLQLFMVPFDIAPTGVVGIAALMNELIGTPIGLVTLILNIPIMMLGYRYLGGWRIVMLSIYAVVVYSLLFDLVTPLFPQEGISDNLLLNALFGGITGGLSVGFVMRAGATFGGTSTLALIIQRKTGTPMSTTYLYTDMGIIGVAGLIYGWEGALYATVALFVSGLASDYVMEGPSVIRTVFIITDKPRAVSDAILNGLQRGVTAWDSMGMYTEKEHSFLYVTIARAQVHELRSLVSDVDSNAFIVIGQGHTAYGAGFKRSKPKYMKV